ncbi:MAG: hypothetical protein IT237_09515 [Bacteroidia bacterium]|nr:hypothetical protein [Bacteroidia bacterium]
MKTSKILLAVIALSVIGAVTFSSCRKSKAFRKEDGQTSADSRTAQGENDAAISDINDVVSNQPLLHGRTNGTSNSNGIMGNICGLTVDTNGAYMGTINLHFNGTTCNNRTREGDIRLTILDYASGKRWKDAGCVMKVEYFLYKVTRASDGKSVRLEGIQYLTNVSGGTWFDLLFLGQPNLVSTVTGENLAVNFDNSSTAVYNINRKFTYTWANNILTCTGEGIGSADGLSNLENYGTTRDGDPFTSQVITPVVWNTTCGAWAPIQGEVDIKVDSKDFKLNCLFGVNQTGNAITVGSNSCPYGWKVSWKYKNKTNTKVLGYW